MVTLLENTLQTPGMITDCSIVREFYYAQLILKNVNIVRVGVIKKCACQWEAACSGETV